MSHKCTWMPYTVLLCVRTSCKNIHTLAVTYCTICTNTKWINLCCFFHCQMSLQLTSGSTPASAHTLWESGHGCLSETTVTPSTCKVLNFSRMHACHVKKVGNCFRCTLTPPPFRLLLWYPYCTAHDTELNWKPIKCNSSDLHRFTHNWQNASICLNLEVLPMYQWAPSHPGMINFHFPFSISMYFCIFQWVLNFSQSWMRQRTDLYGNTFRAMQTRHMELGWASAWEVVQHCLRQSLPSLSTAVNLLTFRFKFFKSMIIYLRLLYIKLSYSAS